jgi:hypothetical protein
MCLRGSLSWPLACTVYTSNGAFPRTIQVSSCSTCPPQSENYAGPDTCALGYFNYNNRWIFSHELLNDFTNRYTRSHTPFNAFVASTTRRYVEYQSVIPFIRDDIFRNVWFSFIKLQSLDDDFTCPNCGPEPRIVVADGITAAFPKKHLTSSLQPPTQPDPSLDCPKVRPVKQPQAVVDSKLRTAALRLLKYQATGILPTKSRKKAQVLYSSGESGEESDNGNKVKTELLKTLLPTITKLKQICEPLALLFQTHVTGKNMKRSDSERVYINLLIQVHPYTMCFVISSLISPHILGSCA